MTLEYHAIEFEAAHDAIQWAEVSGRGVAILLDGPKVVAPEEVKRIAAAGVEFAYLHDHEMPDGTCRIVTVPVN